MFSKKPEYKEPNPNTVRGQLYYEEKARAEAERAAERHSELPGYHWDGLRFVKSDTQQVVRKLKVSDWSLGNQFYGSWPIEWQTTDGKLWATLDAAKRHQETLNTTHDRREDHK